MQVIRLNGPPDFGRDVGLVISEEHDNQMTGLQPPKRFSAACQPVLGGGMGRRLRPTLFDLGGAVDKVPKLGSGPTSPLKDFLGQLKATESSNMEGPGVQRWPSSFVSRRDVTDGRSWFLRWGNTRQAVVKVPRPSSSKLWHRSAESAFKRAQRQEMRA